MLSVGTRADFYEDSRYCTSCDGYVPYLLSPSGAFCVHCDQPVLLFSADEHEAFLRGLADRTAPSR
jgi:hypothetical protein